MDPDPNKYDEILDNVEKGNLMPLELRMQDDFTILSEC